MEKYIDFKCYCGATQCGRLRVLKSDGMLNFGFIEPKTKNPKRGVILGKDDIEKLKKFLSILKEKILNIKM